MTFNDLLCRIVTPAVLVISCSHLRYLYKIFTFPSAGKFLAESRCSLAASQIKWGRVASLVLPTCFPYLSCQYMIRCQAWWCIGRFYFLHFGGLIKPDFTFLYIRSEPPTHFIWINGLSYRVQILDFPNCHYIALQILSTVAVTCLPSYISHDSHKKVANTLTLQTCI